MDKKEFLTEVMRHANQCEGAAFRIEDDNLYVEYGENNEFIVRPSGGITCTDKTEHNDEFHTLYDEMTEIASMVKEYMTAMENAPDLKAIDFNMPYKKLAEFNDTVLGGTKNQSGYSFTTWSYKDNALYHGHYLMKDYNGAKQDFAVRAGLVNENKIFSDKELVEIHRCIEDTFDMGFNLTDKQTEMLENIQTKIKSSVDNFEEQLEEACSQNEEQTLQ